MHCRGGTSSVVPLGPLHWQLDLEEEQEVRCLGRRGRDPCRSFPCDLCCLYPRARPWLLPARSAHAEDRAGSYGQGGLLVRGKLSESRLRWLLARVCDRCDGVGFRSSHLVVQGDRRCAQGQSGNRVVTGECRVVDCSTHSVMACLVALDPEKSLRPTVDAEVEATPHARWPPHCSNPQPERGRRRGERQTQRHIAPHTETNTSHLHKGSPGKVG